MILCKIDQSGTCSQHRRKHIGHAAAIAIEPTEKAEKIRRIWDGGTVYQSSPPRLLRSLPIAKQCRHNTGVNGTEKKGCGSCTTYACSAKNKSVKLSECANCSLWEACTLPSEQPVISEHPRHLLFHLWPKKSTLGVWQRNLDQLKQRWPLFTGKRVIAVATSSDSATLEAVQDYMRGYECEWVHVVNDPNLREVKTFVPLFERVESEPGYTFYAQGKGATKPINRGVTIHAWTAAMYEVLLDYWPLVQETLSQKSIVGIFKKHKLGCFGGSRSDWHYSGSFFWFKNAELFGRRPRLPNVINRQAVNESSWDWRSVEPVWFGIESYPSMMFAPDEAACLFHCWQKEFSLYRLGFWQRVERELAEWRKQAVKYRSDGGVLTTGSCLSAGKA